MEKNFWTENQKNAIFSSGGTVLVSAAAGSGKTAVLVERAVQKILQGKVNEQDKFLIITFTDAAATELKIRISERFHKILNENQTANSLNGQKIIENSEIGTIHSFCAKLIRKYFYLLDISPKFTILDENQLLILKKLAIDEILEDYYGGNDSRFFEVADIFFNGKSDSQLIKTVLEIYDFLQAYSFPEMWIEEKKIMLSASVQNFSETVFGKSLIKIAKESVNYAKIISLKLMEITKQDKNLKKAYFKAVESDFTEFEKLFEALEHCDWNKIFSQIQNFDFKRFSALKNYDDESEKEFIKNFRESTKIIVKKFLCNVFCFNNEKCLDDMKKISKIFEILLEIVTKFDEKLNFFKKEKNALDFDDLEKFAIKLLIERKGEKLKKTSIAQELSKNFCEIMVDECQDVNEKQSLIFKTLSQNENNLFLVGDVKQSIYKFRRAMPEIFLEMKKKYHSYDKLNPKYPAKIILDKNFRSNPEIIDAVNFVFKNIMSESAGNIDYNSEEELCAGIQNDSDDKPKFFVEILEPFDKNSEETNENDDEESQNAREATKIAQIISKMVGKNDILIKCDNSKRPVIYRDFCILHRSANVNAYEFSKKLNELGVPAWSDIQGNLLETPEVIHILSIIRIIDNPIQDIPLVSALLSPIFAFTIDEITSIRAINRNEEFYFALKKSAQNGEQKSVDFLQKLEYYRTYSKIFSVPKLINFIYNDTKYCDIVAAMRNGRHKLKNIRRFIDYALKYTQNSETLSDFIKFIDALQENNATFSSVSPIEENANVVRIMSVHKSKGLEFPICILAGCSKKFNIEKDDFLINSNLGVSLKFRSHGGVVKHDNIIRTAIALENKNEEISEQMRILYVAMTRAKERLILILNLKNKAKSLERAKFAALYSEKIPPFIAKNVQSFEEWILACVLKHPSGQYIRKQIGSEEINSANNSTASERWEINFDNLNFDGVENQNLTPAKSQELFHQNSNITPENELFDEIKKRLSFVYSHKEMTNIPKKISVSELVKKNNYKGTAVKEFNLIDESAKIPLETGNSYHKFLCFADFKKAIFDFDGYLKSLINSGFLTEAQSKLLNKNLLQNFLNSNICQRILKSPKIFREYDFMVRIPANCYDLNTSTYNEKIFFENSAHKDDDKIFVSGVIDCAFEENAEFVIIDYKTDKISNLEVLHQNYAKQLIFYKYALEKSENVKVKELIIYSLPLSNFYVF